jgi:hypothetical protein
LKGKHTHTPDQIEGSQNWQRKDQDFTAWQKSKMPSGSKPVAGALLFYGDPPNDDTLNVDDSRIAALESALAAAQSAISALESVMAGKADTVHSHAIGDVTTLQTVLNSKSDTTHTHSHFTDTENPHGTTAAQTGALPTSAFNGLAKVTVGTTQPINPSPGDVWHDTN